MDQISQYFNFFIIILFQIIFMIVLIRLIIVWLIVKFFLSKIERKQYELKLAASDNLKENYTTVVIHVKDVNDNPPVFERPTYRTQITEEDDRNLPKRVLQVRFKAKAPRFILYCPLSRNSEVEAAKSAWGDIWHFLDWRSSVVLFSFCMAWVFSLCRSVVVSF